MLLTNITNAVVTTTQVILSNVIVELRVLSAYLAKFAPEPMKALRTKCRQWQAAASGRGKHQHGTDRTAMRDFRRSMARFSVSSCCLAIGRCGVCS